jgi:GDP-4-dehydro-6-deoxy-D-mannose reductase
LVTGIAGFAGSYLAEALAARGDVLCGLLEPGRPAANLAEALARHPEALAPERLPVVDVRDAPAVAAVVCDFQPDALVHLAAVAYVPYARAHPEETFAVNVGGTRHVLDAVRAHRPAARALIVTSSDIYDPGAKGDRPRAMDEDHPLGPRNPYGASKAEADRLAAEAAARDRLDVVRVRPFNHTGPRQEPRYVCADFARQVAEAEAGRREPVIRVGNLDMARDFCDVRDVARGYVLALDRARAGTAYNLCSGRAVRIREILDRLVAMARVPIRVEVDPERWRPADAPWFQGNAARARRDLGWTPDIPLEQTLADLLDERRGAMIAPLAAEKGIPS